MFDQQARTRLRDKLDYEQWVLNELEDEHDVFPDRLGDTVIENGDISAQEVAASTASISQPRVDEVIQRLYPLVFAASYKCLDMVIEWILEENTGTLTHQWGYSHKNSEVNRMFHTGNLQLPQPFMRDTDIFERLLRLYDKLMDHRHAVVHRDEFEVNNGVFSVEDDSGTRYDFDATQLFSLAKSGTVSSEVLLNNSMSDDQERALKRYLDNLDFIHGQGTFDIAPPWDGTIEYRIQAEDQDPYRWEIDLDLVGTADESTPSTEGYILKIVGMQEGDTVCAWEIPSEAVPDGNTLELTEHDSRFDGYRL